MRETEIILNTWLYRADHMAGLSDTNPDNFRVQVQNMLDGMIVTMDIQIWGRNLLPQMEFPASWWDAIKLKIFPVWFLRRYPAKIKTVDLRELFPQVSKNPTRIKGSDFLKTKNSVALIEGGYSFPSTWSGE